MIATMPKRRDPLEHLTVTAFAETVGLSRRTIQRDVATKRVKSIKVHGRRLIPRTELERYLDEGDEYHEPGNPDH